MKISLLLLTAALLSCQHSSVVLGISAKAENEVAADEEEGSCTSSTTSSTTASCNDNDSNNDNNDNNNNQCNNNDNDNDSTESNDNKETEERPAGIKIEYRDTCRYYLAESSIPNAGFGIYTVNDIHEHEPMTQVADAPSIIVTDSEMHRQIHDDDSGGGNGGWNHVDYFWDGSGQGEFEAHTVEESVVTFGSLCNYHTYLKNVKPDSHEYVDNLSPRAEGSPGMGAYSYQPGFIFTSSRDIKAGEEIFCDYGEEWLDSRSFGRHITREKEFNTAANVIQTTITGLGGVDAGHMSGEWYIIIIYYFLFHAPSIHELMDGRIGKWALLPPSLPFIHSFIHPFQIIISSS